jgi:hypothetical protein
MAAGATPPPGLAGPQVLHSPLLLWCAASAVHRRAAAVSAPNTAAHHWAQAELPAASAVPVARQPMTPPTVLTVMALRA